MVKNILKGGLASLCVFITSCGAAMKNNPTEFDWYATECAPKHYPMKIIQGTFYYKDQEKGLYIPSGGQLSAGWGHGISSHVTGSKLKPLPDSVAVVFYSYTEKQFYKGEFDLPYEKILALFREDYEKNKNDLDYDSIMLGVAPGGAVSVWVNGATTKEIFAGQAEKIDMTPTSGFALPFDSEAEGEKYMDDILVGALEPEELASLKKNGIPFGLWARYRHLYKWAPAYKNGQVSTDKTMPVNFLNGEKDWRVPTLFSDEMANTPHPLPRSLKFSAPAGNESYYFIIDFDEFELMNAFEKLGAHGEKVYLEFEPRSPRQHMKIRVYNDKESIELKKMRIRE
ncbi:MAG: DUF2931 family protein [Pseudomonadota bacterium]